MTRQNQPQLSKSRFMAGIQCLKRLYLECYHRELADPVDVGQQAIFDSGTAVGELARELFPGGRLVEERYYEPREAERTTVRLLSDDPVPSLFESAFTFEGVHTRVDILRRTEGDEFDLIEVKSTTSPKNVHIPDVAIQLHVVEGCGVPIRRAYLMHIDNAYVYEGGDHNLDGLFAMEDVTDRARSFIEISLSDALPQMWESLESAEALTIETGRHCTTPYRCPFFGHCHRDEPEHPIRNLPNLRHPIEERLKSEGITDIPSIPPGHPGLSAIQRRVRDSVATGRPYVGDDLADRLTTITYPACFLDFETFSPAVPIYPGTRPYQTIPFQWSLHIRDADGGLTHGAFLDDGCGDPRERFVTSLLDAMPSEGAIVAYSGYEAGVIRDLAAEMPEYEHALLDLQKRIIDLLQLIRRSYYHPQFHGSFSLKSVVTALVPDLVYDDLEIREGASAAAYYSQLVGSDVPESNSHRIRKGLLTYCARDTEAMMRVYEALMAEAGN